MPAGADKFVFFLAPISGLVVALLFYQWTRPANLTPAWIFGYAGVFVVATLMQGQRVVAAEVVACRRVVDSGEEVGVGVCEELLARQHLRQQVVGLGMGRMQCGEFFQSGARLGKITALVGTYGLTKDVHSALNIVCES